MLPKINKNMNMFYEDQSWAGLLKDVVPPKLVRKMEELRAAGMNAPVEIDLGHEKLEMEVTLLEYNRRLIEAWADPDIDGVLLRLRVSAESETASVTDAGLEFVVRCRPREIDFGTIAGSTDLTNMKVMLSVSYFKYSQDGQTVVELDPGNMIEVVGGVDRLAGRRARLGL